MSETTKATTSEAEQFVPDDGIPSGSAAPTARKRERNRLLVASSAAPDLNEDIPAAAATPPADTAEAPDDGLAGFDAMSLDILAAVQPPAEATPAPVQKTVAPAPAAGGMDDLAVAADIYAGGGEGHPDYDDDVNTENASNNASDNDFDEDFNAAFFAALQDEPVAAAPAEEDTIAAPSAVDADLTNLLPEIDFSALAASLSEPAEPTPSIVAPAGDDEPLEEKVRRAIAESEAEAPADEGAMLRRQVAELERRLAKMEERPQFNGHVVAAEFSNRFKTASYRAGTMAIGAGYALRRFFQKGSIGLMVGDFMDRVCMPALRVAKALSIGAVLSYAAISAVEDTTGKSVTQHAAGIGEVLQEKGVDVETASKAVNDHFLKIIKSDPALAMTDYGISILEVVKVDSTEQKAGLAPETAVRPQLPGENTRNAPDENMMTEDELDALGMNSNRI